MARVNVYVGRFNFYYGAVRCGPFRWLDFEKLAKQLVHPSDQIGLIRYFTAQVSSTPNDPTKTERQSTYVGGIGLRNGQLDRIPVKGRARIGEHEQRWFQKVLLGTSHPERLASALKVTIVNIKSVTVSRVQEAGIRAGVR